MQIVRSRMSGSVKCARRRVEERVVDREVVEREPLGVLDRDALRLGVLGVVAVLGDVRIELLVDALLRATAGSATPVRWDSR